MRSWITIAFALSAILSSSLSAQEGGNFPWRKQTNVSNSPSTIRMNTETGISNGQIVSGNRLRVASLPQEVRGSLSRPPAAPPTERSPFLVSFRKQQDDKSLQDSQPSISDQLIEAPQDDQAVAEQPIAKSKVESPAAAVAPAPSVYQTPFENEPPLSVYDNSKAEEPNYCNRDCSRDWCNLGCEKKLFGTHCSGLEMGGWVSLGYHNRDTIMVNNRRGEANLHQVWLYADKAVNNQGWGYRFDLLYGVDAQDLQAFGNGPTGNPSGWDNAWDFGSYGWALPQAYLQMEAGDWDIKAGKFFSPFGYEVIGARDNFFYSHSYTMYNSEPFTMTGVLGERQVSDTRSIILGVTAGWDTAFDNNEGGGNLITGTRLQPNEFVDLALTSSLGDAGTRGNGNLTSAVAQVQLTDDLKYVFQADVLNLDDNNEFGVVQYLFRDVNPCLGLGARLEWWKSDQFFADTKSTWSYTMGANFRRSANLVIRPEVRFDWGAAAIDPGTPIIGIDAVMTF